MADARRSCQAENADLIQFRNRDVEQFFLNYGYNGKNCKIINKGNLVFGADFSILR